MNENISVRVVISDFNGDISIDLNKKIEQNEDFPEFKNQVHYELHNLCGKALKILESYGRDTQLA